MVSNISTIITCICFLSEFFFIHNLCSLQTPAPSTKLNLVRAEMSKENVEAYIVPMDDSHQVCIATFTHLLSNYVCI